MIRRIIAGCLVLVLCISALCGCIPKMGRPDGPGGAKGATLIDVFGREAVVDKDARVVSCYGSFADCWLLSGGELVGVTEDAVNEHGLDVGTASVVGTVKHINLEQLTALTPDYVILSADLAAHIQLRDALDQLGIAYGYFRVDTFDDYKALMRQFCTVNGRHDRYETNVAAVEQRIRAIMDQIPSDEDRSVLLMRVFSTGMKAKTDDNLAGQILKAFGLRNIADDTPSMLEDLSVEQVIRTDPDYIFATTMGGEESAKAYLRDHVENNPAWSGLQAVEKKQYVMLPKDLFHYKPNERWDESYAYLAKIIYPHIFQ